MKYTKYILALSSVLVLPIAASEKRFNCYVQGEFGASFAMKPNFCVDTSSGKWDAVPEGYNSSLGAAPLVGFGFGFSSECHPWISLGFSANVRKNFKFCKNQSAGTILTRPHTAYLNVNNSSYMVNLFINKGSIDPYFSYDFCSVRWMPFVGAGIGLGRNTLFNFHAAKQEANAIGGVFYNGVPTIMMPITFNRFAWQIQVGLDGVFRDMIEFGVSYRFFDSGKLATNNYMAEFFQSAGSHRYVAVPAWRGKFRANELVFHLGMWF